MIKRQNTKKDNKVKVTFVLPYDPEQANISVVGDFNDWTPESNKLVKRSNGTCSASISLNPGQRYLFRDVSYVYVLQKRSSLCLNPMTSSS